MIEEGTTGFEASEDLAAAVRRNAPPGVRLKGASVMYITESGAPVVVLVVAQGGPLSPPAQG
jgi:hypothetical protein